MMHFNQIVMFLEKGQKFSLSIESFALAHASIENLNSIQFQIVTTQIHTKNKECEYFAWPPSPTMASTL